MKKRLLFALAILLMFSCPLEAEAKRTTIKKTIVVGDTHTIYTPAYKQNKKKSKMTRLYKVKKLTLRNSKKKSIKKSSIVTVTGKPKKKTWSLSKNYIKVKGKKAGKVYIDVTTSNKKQYRYAITVVAKPKASSDGATDSTEDNSDSDTKDTTVKKYSNNGEKCFCGGDWEIYTVTDTYKPSVMYYGYANNVSWMNMGQEQAWDKNEWKASEGPIYYPLDVCAIPLDENGDVDTEKYDYHNYSGAAGTYYTFILHSGHIPAVYGGKSMLFGNSGLTDDNLDDVRKQYPDMILWSYDRGGQYESVSVDDYQETKTAYTCCICKKCGAMKK